MSKKNRNYRSAVVEDVETPVEVEETEEIEVEETETEDTGESIVEPETIDASEETETEEIPEVKESIVEPTVEPVDTPEEDIEAEPEVETKETEETTEEKEEEVSDFSKEALIEILDSTVEIDETKATIYNTVDDMVAAAKLEKIYKMVAKAGANTPVARVISQALKFANTSADRRKGDILFSTLMREINTSTPGKDFDLLMFVVTRTFKALRTLSETAVVRSFREVRNVEVKQSSLLLSHLISQLATAEDRKKKIGVTISLDRAVQVSPNGLNQNGANLIKDYFKK